MTRTALVVLDTLRKDRFDEHFDWLPGRRFERAYSTANWTIPAHASMFTGLYGAEAGATARHRRLDTDSATLVERLRERGVQTVAVNANGNLHPSYGWDRGFEDWFGPSRIQASSSDVVDWDAWESETGSEGFRKYLDAAKTCVTSDSSTIRSLLFGYRLLRGGYWDTRAEQVADTVRDVEFDDDAFLFVNFMDAHTPYDPPERYYEGSVSVGTTDGLGFEEPDADVDAAYEAAVSYLSDAYRDLFDYLGSEFDYVLTVSDHGELLGEHGQYNHLYGLYPELTHVPLVVSGDGTGVDHRPVSLLDVYRTVLDLFDVEAPRFARGASLVDGAPRDGTVGCLYRGLLPAAFEGLRENGYDDEIDHLEEPLNAVATVDGYAYQTNDGLVNDSTVGDAAIRDRMTAFVERLDEHDAVDPGEGPALDDDLHEQLENLGYV